MTDSRNALTDFDLCLALAQTSLDSQLGYAWKAWKRRRQLDETLKLHPLKKDGTPSPYGLTATLAPLRVDLNVPDAKLAQVKVTLTLLSGTVTYYDEDNDEAAEAPIDNWSVSFLTDLDKKPVDLVALRAIDPASAQTAQDAIDSAKQQAGLPDDVFSIEYLFLELTNANLLMADNHDVNIPPDVPQAARVKALSLLGGLLQSGDSDDFLLGTVVRRNAGQQQPPTFALTDFVFDVHAVPEAPAASTLSYLGALAGRPLPADKDGARVALQDRWIDPAMVDGSKGLVSGLLAIRKEVFVDNYLMPQFAKALGGLQPQADGLNRRFQREETQSNRSRDIIDHFIDLTKGFELNVAIRPGSASMDVTGRVYCSFVYREHTLGPAGMETAKLDAAGEAPITGSVALSTPGGTSAFRLDPQFDYSFGDFHTTRNEASGFGKVEEAFSEIPKLLGITGGTLLEIMTHAASDIVGELEDGLRQAFSQLELDLSQHSFVPPGGGVFAFQNFRFSGATGDLLLDAIYKAP